MTDETLSVLAEVKGKAPKAYKRPKPEAMASLHLFVRNL